MCNAPLNFNLFIIFCSIILQNVLISLCNDQCENEKEENCISSSPSHTEGSVKWGKYLNQIEKAVAKFKPCEQSDNSTCFLHVIKNDLSPFKAGITKDKLSAAAEKGTKYQIINGKVYRQDECMFPSRCSGIEHFLLKIASKLPNLEMIINTRDWPQVSKHFSSEPLPVFSFSKTGDYYDIMYPTWSYWAGGPAIKLYPRGLGRWDEHRAKLKEASARWPWKDKESRGFFRGSRTSAERDPLVLLSRETPDLVDAQYTKNQAWKSVADTLNAPPASEVSLEDHCQYKFLFNFRGVAASFRFKHLFLCGSLVLHVGDQWLEFFYPAMRPWVHYIPLPASATKTVIRETLEFALENDDVVHALAERGRNFITDHLRMTDIEAYWLRLLKRMYQFTRGEGALKTTQDLFTQAEYFAEEANRLYKVVRQFSYQVPGGGPKKELLAQLDGVPTHVQQLQFTVKTSTVGKAATFNKVDAVITQTKSLMNVIAKVVSTCFLCATKYNLDFRGLDGSRESGVRGGGGFGRDDDGGGGGAGQDGGKMGAGGGGDPSI